MKIFSADQVRQADHYTIEHEPVKSIDLMERAARAFVRWFVEQYPTPLKVHVFCGTGNNGGDGMAISRMLVKAGWNVNTSIVDPSKRQSEDFRINFLLLREMIDVREIHEEKDVPDITQSDIVIDAIFGSGLSRPAEGLFGQVIDAINHSGAAIVAVDMPSGLFADRHSRGKHIIAADQVVSFQLPKLSFFLPENGTYVKNWHVVDIGLHQDFLQAEPAKHLTIDADYVVTKLPHRTKHSYKNQLGHALLAAGGYGKMGAAVLAAKACMRAGAGLLTVHIPVCGYEIIQSAVPEAMCSIDTAEDFLHSFPETDLYSAVGMGPGIGTDEYTTKALARLLSCITQPLVMDADALNILSGHPDMLDIVPARTIITPHPGEFKRITGAWADDFDRLAIQRKWSVERQWIIVLKGAHTSVSLPDGRIFFNTTGNPGMATAGSGDVLTGVITGLLSQGLAPEEAAICGVWLHGKAGDLAAHHHGQISMMAGDIIAFLPEVIKNMRG